MIHDCVRVDATAVVMKDAAKLGCEIGEFGPEHGSHLAVAVLLDDVNDAVAIEKGRHIAVDRQGTNT